MCKTLQDKSVNYSDVSKLDFVSINDKSKFPLFPKINLKSEGCFLSGAGRLKTKTKLAYINTARMLVTEQYLVSVVVRSGKRVQGVYHQTIKVLAKPPRFSIR